MTEGMTKPGYFFNKAVPKSFVDPGAGELRQSPGSEETGTIKKFAASSSDAWIAMILKALGISSRFVFTVYSSKASALLSEV